MNTRERHLEHGDQVLILLPTSNNKLLAHLQRRYPIIQQQHLVNYEVDMQYDRKKCQMIFHLSKVAFKEKVWEEKVWEDKSEGILC